MSRYEREATGALEILKDRFYFITVRNPPRSDAFSHYFTVEDDLTYEPFFADFGPLNLGHVYTYCHFLDEKLKDEKHMRKKIYHYASNDGAKRTNAVFLIGCYCVLVLGQSPDEVYHTFMNVQPPLMLYRDASMGPSSFGLSVLDSWRGLVKAQSCGFFSLDTFDVNEYYFYERVENGDMNWILPGKFLAFSGPHSSHHNEAGLRTLTPEDYIPYFRKHSVNHVVRLNKKAYDKRRFTDYGVGHTDLYFIDGSTPSDAIVQKFISLVESESGAVAVHCKAGLGRTGTLIACYIMKHYKFTAQEIIGWLRICRPGSVIGPQQHFLISLQAALWKEGDTQKRKSLQQSGRSEVSIETSRSSKLTSSGKSVRSDTQRSTTSLSAVSVGVRSEATPKTPTSNRRSGDYSVYNSSSNTAAAPSSPFTSTKDKLKADMRIITATLKSMRTTPSGDDSAPSNSSDYRRSSNNNNNNYDYAQPTSSPIPPPTLYSTSPYATPSSSSPYTSTSSASSSRLSNLFTKSKLPSGLSLQQRKQENQRHRGGSSTSASSTTAPAQKSSPPPKSIMSVARSTSPTTASRAYGSPTPTYTPTKTSSSSPSSSFTPGHRKTRSSDNLSAQYSTPTYNSNNNNNNNNNVNYMYSPASPAPRTPDYATSASSVNTTSPMYYTQPTQTQRSKTPPTRRTSGEFDTRTLSAYSSYSSTTMSSSDVYKQRRLSAPRYLRT